LIHERLKDYSINFCKISDDGKNCFEKRWNTRVYKYDNSSLAKHMRQGGSYGVQINHSSVFIDGVWRQLLIIDFDNRELQDKVLHLFPDTFTTTSGSKKNCYHIWLGIDEQSKIIHIKDKEGNTLADVLGEHGQVVAPNSKHPSGSTYSVVKDVDFAFIPYDKVLEILRPFNKQKEKAIIQQTERKDYGTNSFYDMVRSKLNVIDVLNKVGIDTTKPRTTCPLGHESVGGECFHYDEEVWKCHNCDESGNLFQLVQKIHKLSAKETFEKLAEMTNLQDELLKHQSNYLKAKEES